MTRHVRGVTAKRRSHDKAADPERLPPCLFMQQPNPLAVCRCHAARHKGARLSSRLGNQKVLWREMPAAHPHGLDDQAAAGALPLLWVHWVPHRVDLFVVGQAGFSRPGHHS